jgi:hypothetical protein
MKPTLSDYRLSDIGKLKRDVSISRNVEKVILIVATGLLINTVAFPNQPKDQMIKSLGLTSVLGFVGAYWKQSKKELNERFDSYIELNREQFKHELKQDYVSDASRIEHEFRNKNAITQVSNQLQLAETLAGLPPNARLRYRQEFNLQGLLDPPESTSDLSGITDQVTLPSYENIIESPQDDSGVIFDWMKKAVNCSCFLAGKKRSGKTYFMKWLLSQYIDCMSEKDTFYISDPHYDDADYDDPWITVEADKKLIENGRLVKGEADTLRMLSSVMGAFKIRKDNGLTLKKGVGCIRLFMDEVDSYSKEAQEKISGTIKTIEYEAAKYGVTICLGVHSIKKGEMGIDSSVIASMMQVLFSGIILDSNSIVSGAFPPMPTRKAAIEIYKQEHQTERVVYIADDTEVFVSHIPNLKLPSYVPPESGYDQSGVETEEYFSDDSGVIEEQPNDRTDVPPESSERDFRSYYESMTKWIRLCLDTHQRYPVATDIKTAWLQLTGQDLSEAALCLLIEKLFKDVQ